MACSVARIPACPGHDPRDARTYALEAHRESLHAEDPLRLAAHEPRTQRSTHSEHPFRSSTEMLVDAVRRINNGRASQDYSAEESVLGLGELSWTG